jgi:hypothetical protein
MVKIALNQLQHYYRQRFGIETSIDSRITVTAEEIFDLADVEDDTDIILSHFRDHLHDQHWREVLLLLVSKLKGKKAQM